jgi:hypothetical protein
MLPLLNAAIALNQTRRVFEAWSIRIPETFSETFVAEDSYWHAWDEDRSVSLTSVVVTDKRRPVSAAALTRDLIQEMDADGTAIEDVPAGLRGRAWVAAAIPPARASMALTGLLAVDGRILLATITSDDLDWARETWLSIRSHPAPISRHSSGRRKRAGQQRR